MLLTLIDTRSNSCIGELLRSVSLHCRCNYCTTAVKKNGWKHDKEHLCWRSSLSRSFPIQSMQHDLRPRVLILASHLPLTNRNESISLFMFFYRGRKNLAVEQYSSHMFMETRYTILQLPLKPVNLEYQQIVHSDDKQHINYHCSIVTKNIQVVLHPRHKHSSQWMYIAIILFSKLRV